eukprot:TRINITY_DN2898_c0_g1_i1.p1 TRINITY_DN2898_c0_g1~~TRINITY_DN2898_c0_g1_i1.p1  ORF type:complete len:345 (-),score=86.35 TRINITY_DN2898_c0_g1_i1:156-1145(-)
METYIGIEGGGTATKASIFNREGRLLASCEIEQSSNPYLMGIEKTAVVLSNLCKDLKLRGDYDIKGIGMSLSGVESFVNVDLLKQRFQELFEGDYIIVFNNDAVGAGYTAAHEKTVYVLISGTGSCGRMIDVSKPGSHCSLGKVGGWGHMVYEKGCGWSVAHTAITDIFRKSDGFSENGRVIPDEIEEVIFNHFDLSFSSLVKIFYGEFNKASIASLTKKLSEKALQGDEYCQKLFNEMGEQLAELVVQMQKKVFATEIVAVGSLWKTWNLFSEAFLNYLENNNVDIHLITLLDDIATYGAAKSVALERDILLDIHKQNNIKTRTIYEK